MAQETLVDGALRLVARLDARFSGLSMAALTPIPVDDEQEGFEPRYAFVISGGFGEDDLRGVLTSIATEINSAPLEILDRLALGRIVVLPPSDPFVQGVLARYRGQLQATPLELAEEEIANRATRGGVLLLLRDSVPEPDFRPLWATGPLRDVVDIDLQEISLLQADERIAGSPISKDRRESFVRRFEESRHKAGSLRRIFRDAHAYDRVGEPKDAVGYGMQKVLHKGPFVDDQSWAELDPWPLVVALETHLHTELSRQLDGAAVTQDLPEQWEVVRAALMSAVDLSGSGTAFFLQGSFSTAFRGDIARDDSILERYGEIDTGPWFLGNLMGSPLLHLRNEADVPATAYAVRLDEAFRMRQFDSVESPNSDYTIEIRSLDDAEIEEISHSPDFLELNPSWAGLTPMLLNERLRARAVLRIYEYVQLTTINLDQVSRLKITAR